MQTRREFLKLGALAAGTLFLGGCRGFFGNDADAPADAAKTREDAGTVNLAFFGLGGMGMADLEALLHVKGVRAVAVCDPDSRRCARAKKIVREAGMPEPEAFADYRTVFDRARERIDGAVVATPDHSHFAVAMEAVSRGKHVFVEKPLCRTIDQVRRLTLASREAGVVTQAGNQGAASQHVRLAREWYEAGILGEVREIHAWTNRPVWPQGMAEEPAADPCPAALDWNLWLGASRERPYSKAIAPFNWRGWTEFGTGALGDMAQHVLNPAYYIFGLGVPESIEAESVGGTPLAFPTSSKITYVFPGNASRGPLKIVWFDGSQVPPRPAGLPAGVAFPNGIGGSVFYGSANTMLLGASGETLRLLRDEAAVRANPPPRKYPRVRGNIYRNWIEGIRTGAPTVSGFDYAAPLTEIVLLGVIAQRLGRRLEWDAANGRFRGDAEADALLKAVPARPGFAC